MERGAFSRVKQSKKGLSPLIATVLLIAFAVALGVMVMNWGKSAAEGKPGETPACQMVKFDPCSIDSQSLLCVNPVPYNLRAEPAEYQVCTS